VISLDVFDTLILRPFRTPTDLFHTLEGKWQRAARRNMTSFAQARIEAESCARAWLPETQADVTMWNIYSAMMQNLGVSDDCVGQMTYNEREAEVYFCRPRKTGVQLFHLAKAAGKRVVLTSDMYLDADTIRRMLEKCGIRGWDGFFLSNEQNALKWNGALYRKMTAQLGVKPDHVLHIGDNAKIDVEAAKKAGLRAMLLPRPADVFMDADCTQMANLGHGCLAGFTTADAMQPLALRCAQGMAANRFFDDGYAPATADSAFAAYPSRLGTTPSAHTCWRWQSGCCAAAGRMA
jgi:FMN phosphatase YigB (HAD superfamily)